MSLEGKNIGGSPFWRLGLVAVVLLATACQGVITGGGGGEEAVADGEGDAPSTALDPATLGPDEVIGQGPYGEPAASPDELALSEDEAETLRNGDFEVGIVMHTLDLDWSRLQIQGIEDTLAEYGVEVVGITDAGFRPEQQINDIADMIQLAPDAIISIPVDDTATASAYQRVSEAGIELVFMDNVPVGLEHPDHYASMISADSQGNGAIAAEVLASYVPEGGTVGIIEFGIDFFVTNERVVGVRNWFEEHRPDVQFKSADFINPDDATAVAENFLTANADLDGLFVVWDAPAMGAVTAARTVGRDLPITTIDLGQEVALNMAQGGLVKGLGAQRPYDQGVAEAMAALNALLDKTPPPWVGVPSLAVVPANLLEAYREVFKEDPPQEIVEACEANPECN